MIREVTLPEISENVDSGDVVQVLVSEGDRVENEQGIVELETEKAAFEVPSPAAGTVSEIAVKAGDTVQVGQLLLKLETEEGEAAEAEEAGAAEEGKEGKKAEKPKEREEAAAGAEEGEGPPGEERPEGDERATREERSEKTEAEDRPKAEERPQPSPRDEREETGAPVPASPAVRRLARELGVDIRSVEGSGPGGRISREDVKAFAKQALSGAGEAAGATGGPPARGPAERELPDFSRWGTTRREPMTKVRSITADNTVYAWNAVPHVTHFDRADVTEVERFRNRYGKVVEKEGGKLTLTAVLLKVVAEALRAFPRFNASLDNRAREIVYKEYVNIGVAVDTDRGLLVPVIRDVDRKDLTRLSVELGEIAGKARGRRIRPDDLEGGNFTISNLGGIGGTGFTPIIYSPQVAVLGVARARQEPVYDGGEFHPRLILPLSVTYDHRVIDGADGARFMRWIVAALENPLVLFLKGGEQHE